MEGPSVFSALPNLTLEQLLKLRKEVDEFIKEKNSLKIIEETVKEVEERGYKLLDDELDLSLLLESNDIQMLDLSTMKPVPSDEGGGRGRFLYYHSVPYVMKTRSLVACWGQILLDGLLAAHIRFRERILVYLAKNGSSGDWWYIYIPVDLSSLPHGYVDLDLGKSLENCPSKTSVEMSQIKLIKVGGEIYTFNNKYRKGSFPLDIVPLVDIFAI